jgi:hypothetical protein
MHSSKLDRQAQPQADKQQVLKLERQDHLRMKEKLLKVSSTKHN